MLRFTLLVLKISSFCKAWELAETLNEPGAAADHIFGSAVSMSGDYIIVGASQDAANTGAAYIYRDTGSTHEHEATLRATATETAKDRFGLAVAIHGTTAVVGAPFDENDSVLKQSGSVYIFDRDDVSGQWTQTQKLQASDEGKWYHFGGDVAIDGDTIIVGSPSHDNATGVKHFDSGAAYVFTRTTLTGVWENEVKLNPTEGLVTMDAFGSKVAVHKDTAVVGAVGDDADAGFACVFDRDGGKWSQRAKLVASDGRAGDNFGNAIDVFNGTIVVGAQFHVFDAQTLDTNDGAAYFFTQDSNGSWNETAKLTAVDAAAGAEYGRSVALGDGTAVVGAYKGEAVYVVQRSPEGIWQQETQEKVHLETNVTGDNFGYAIDFEAGNLVSGAYKRERDGVHAGAVFIFRDTGSQGGGQIDVVSEAPSTAPSAAPSAEPATSPTSSPTSKDGGKDKDPDEEEDECSKRPCSTWQLLCRFCYYMRCRRFKLFGIF